MNDQTGSTCRNLSWLAGALAGVLVFLYAWRAQESGLLWALFIGLIVFIVVGWLLIRFLCGDSAAKAALVEPSAPAPAAKPAPAAAKPAAPAAKPAPAPAAKPAPAPAAKPAPAPAAKPAPAAAKAKPAPAAAKPASAAAASDGAKPAALASARGGTPDDLKLIKGIGPGREKMLNEMGVFHFDQIAGWSAAEVAWVDENMLRFKGRATQDNWVAQAAKLAAGGDVT